MAVVQAPQVRQLHVDTAHLAAGADEALRDGPPLLQLWQLLPGEPLGDRDERRLPGQERPAGGRLWPPSLDRMHCLAEALRILSAGRWLHRDTDHRAGELGVALRDHEARLKRRQQIVEDRRGEAPVVRWERVNREVHHRCKQHNAPRPECAAGLLDGDERALDVFEGIEQEDSTDRRLAERELVCVGQALHARAGTHVAAEIAAVLKERPHVGIRLLPLRL